MDNYSQYKKQLEFYNRLEVQRENYVDLTKEQSNENDSIVKFATILFNKSHNNLDQDLSGILIDETMESVDIFCMLIELVLYGLNVLARNTDANMGTDLTIFDLVESSDRIVDVINCYLKSCGFKININEQITDDDAVLYRDKDDYYCEIVEKPPSYLCHEGWYVMNYRLINNSKFKFMSITPLHKFVAFFISKQNKIFTIKFGYHIGK